MNKVVFSLVVSYFHSLKTENGDENVFGWIFKKYFPKRTRKWKQ